MTTVTSYQDLLDRDHAALVAESERIDAELAAARFKAFEERARDHADREARIRHYNIVADRRRLQREQEDMLWGMSMPVVNDTIMGWRR